MMSIKPLFLMNVGIGSCVLPQPHKNHHPQTRPQGGLFAFKGQGHRQNASQIAAHVDLPCATQHQHHRLDKTPQSRAWPRLKQELRERDIPLRLHPPPHPTSYPADQSHDRIQRQQYPSTVANLSWAPSS